MRFLPKGGDNICAPVPQAFEIGFLNPLSPKRPPLPKLTALAAFLVLATLAVMALSLWQSRESLEAKAADDADNLSHLLERYLHSALHETELALLASVDEYRRLDGLGRPAAGEFKAHLRRQLERLPASTRLCATDAAGAGFCYGGGRPEGTPVDISDRPYFLQARDSGAFAISPPVVSRAERRPVLPLARRLLTHSGEFAGVLVATTPVEDLVGLVSSLALGQHGSVVIFDAERTPFLRLQQAGDGLDTPAFRAAWNSGREAARFLAESGDGEIRTYSYRRAGSYPVHVMVGLARSDYFKPWWREAGMAAGLVVALLASSALLAAQVRRSWRARDDEHRRYEHLLRTASDGIHILNERGRLIEASDAFCAMLGYRREELLGKHVSLWEGEWGELELDRNLLPKLLTQTSIFETCHRRRDGTVINVQISATGIVVDGERVLYASARDITERKRFEREMRDNATLLRQAQEIGGLGSFDYDIAADTWVSSPVLDRLFGIGADFDRSAEGWLGLVHPADRAAMQAALGEAVTTGKRFDHEYRIVRPDGQESWLHGLGEVEFDIDDRPCRIVGANQDITAQKLASAALQREHAFRRRLIESLPGIFYLFDRAGRLRMWNRNLTLLSGRGDDELARALPLDLILPDDRPALEAAIDRAFEEGQSSVDARAHSVRGLLHYSFTGMRIDLDDGPGIIGLGVDISERKQAEEQMRLAHVAFTNSREAIIVTDEQARILDVNPAFTGITGYTREEVIGRNPSLLKSGHQDAGFYRAMWQNLEEQGGWEGELWNRRKDGHPYIQYARISAVRDDAGQIRRYVCVASDVTQFRESQRRVEHMAYYDPLTNLPNRTLLADRLRQAIAQADRRQGILAVCYLDLDGFKPVNDTWGHEVGDKLLVEVARRLQGCVRSGDTVSRLGGDEFVVLIGDASDPREIDQAVRRILATVAAPFHIGHATATLTASLGATIYPHDGEDPDTLVRHADQAMYSAKQAGKNAFHLFDAESDRRLRADREISSRVEAGLQNGEFCLYYQPKVDMRQGKVVGLEALLRWRHPERGLLLPDTFLPSIEHSPLAAKLGHWVLGAALDQLSAWKKEGLKLPISVNIAGDHLQMENFVDELSGLLAAYPGIEPGLLELEILETTAMDDIDAVSRIVSACSALGVSFALDDFGTGYSSLTYFRRLPTDMLKIDQSFVRDMLEDADDLAIVEGVIGLAQTFQRKIIAEGVETVDHGIPLLHFGCDLAQGYGIARPMPASDVPAWTRSWKMPPEWELMAMVRWPREDFPLLLAEIHHRRWVERVAKICEGEDKDERPAPDVGHCRFTQWLGEIGRKRYRHLPSMAALETAHAHAHNLGSELVALAANDREAARRRIGELYSVRDELLSYIEEVKLHASMEAPPC